MRSLIRRSSASPPFKPPSLSLLRSMVPTLRRQQLQLTSSGLVMALALKCAHFETWLSIIFANKEETVFISSGYAMPIVTLPQAPVSQQNGLLLGHRSSRPWSGCRLQSTDSDGYQPINSPWYELCSEWDARLMSPKRSGLSSWDTIRSLICWELVFG